MSSMLSGREAQLSWRAIAIRFVLVLGGLAVFVFSVPLADLDDLPVSLVQLQLIGDADHVPASDVIAEGLQNAYFWDLLLVAAYAALLGSAADLACRGYRLRLMRDTVRRGCLAAVGAAAALDVVETTLMLWQLSSRPVDGRLDALVWPLIAALNWAKLLALAGVVVVVLGGICSFLSTPPWLRAAIAQSELPKKDDSASLQGQDDGQRQVSPLGIALSGGGVRSASISLGALQDLEFKEGDLGWNDASHVTAVSGGAYMAGAFSIARNRPSGGGRPRAEADAWRRPKAGHLSPEERHLLHNLGYLTARAPRGQTVEDGFGEERTQSGNTRAGYHRASAAATLTAGLLANILVLWAALGVLILPYGWMMQWLETPNIINPQRALLALVSRQNIVQPGLVWLGVGLVLTLVWVLASRIPRLRRSPGLLRTLEAGSIIGLTLGAVFLVFLVALPWLAGRMPTSAQGLASALVAGAAALAAQARLLIKPAARYASKIGGIAFLVMLVLVVALWTRVAFQQAPDLERVVSVQPELSTPLITWLCLVGFLVVTWFAVSPESWSLAAFYRGRLRMAYATFRANRSSVTCLVNDSDEDRDQQRFREPALKAFQARVSSSDPPKRPQRATPLTICAASTITTRAVRTHYGIPALSVTFSPDKVRVFVPQDAKDSFTTLECDTKDMHAAYRSKWWKPRGRLTTMFAVATSGAAVSPAMGRFRIGPTSMLLTFANARLGVWLPNPRYVNQIEWKGHRSFPKTRLGYLFKEFFGIHDPTDAFLYVTDGGHWENTGLVELLRLSDYDEIVCIDADQGPADRVKALAQAVDLAKLECDVDINIDLDALRATRDSGGGPPYASRSVTLGLVHGKDRTGVLWYAKPALTKDMPTQLLAHREVRQDFPRTSTLNQFFDTSTFFAYRDLGRYNAWQIRRARKHLRAVLRANPTYEDFRTVMESTEITESTWAGCQLYDCLRREPREFRDLGYTQVRAALGVTDPEPQPQPQPSTQPVRQMPAPTAETLGDTVGETADTASAATPVEAPVP